MSVNRCKDGFRFGLAVTALLLAGCPAPPPGGGSNTNQNVNDNVVANENTNTSMNRAPTADAGADELADAGQNIVLDGSASRDPDGDELTFLWTQTGGPGVNLQNETTATASFATPNVNATLEFELTVTDPGGLEGMDRVLITVAAAESTLFVVNNDSGAITTFFSPETLEGDVAPANELGGSETQLFRPRAVVVNRVGNLMACNETADSITVYENASSADGNIPPIAIIEGDATMLDSPVAMAVDTDNDLLFVVNIEGEGGVLVYADVSTLLFNGDVGPVRNFFTTDTIQPLGLFLDEDGRLYVVNQFTLNSASILVFDDAATLDGTVTPNRTISSLSIGSRPEIYITRDDNLFVADGGESLFRFAGASTLDSNVNPTATIPIIGASQLLGLAVDRNGTAFMGDRNLDVIFSLDDAAEQTGIVAPSRIIDGSDTRIRGPVRMYLREQ